MHHVRHVNQKPADPALVRSTLTLAVAQTPFFEPLVRLGMDYHAATGGRGSSFAGFVTDRSFPRIRPWT